MNETKAEINVAGDESPQDNNTNNNYRATSQMSSSRTVSTARSAAPRQLTPLQRPHSTSQIVPPLPLDNIAPQRDPSASSTQPNIMSSNVEKESSYKFEGYDDALISPGLQRALIMAANEQQDVYDNYLDHDKRDKRLVASEHVLEQAYRRCLGSLESQARQEDVLNHQLRASYDSWMQAQRRKKDEAKDQMRSLEVFLQQQINEYHERKKRDKHERKNATISHELPGSLPMVLSTGVPKTRTCSGDGPANPVSNDELLQNLEYQIRTNKDKKDVSKKQALEEEREYLEHVAMELDMQSAAERTAHLQKQKTLLEAWEREAHIRNLKKLQRKGSTAVSSYMNTNLGGMENETLQMKSLGIGYDSRKFGGK